LKSNYQYQKTKYDRRLLQQGIFFINGLIFNSNKRSKSDK